MAIYRYSLTLALLGITLLAVMGTARADFLVKNAPPLSAPTASPAVVEMAPIVNPGDSASKAQPKTTWRWRIARGFGNNVPLGFACRQIVPPAVRVTFGPGASPSTLVTWEGGKGWNQVLREAVKPVGLRLVMTYMAVEIRK